MMTSFLSWTPAAALSIGAMLTLGTDNQRALPLRADLGSTVPTQIEGYAAKDLVVPEAERKVAGMSSYLMRVYSPAEKASQAASFSLYVGYYESQTAGNTIHSPKNCLPGAGWEALTSQTQAIRTAMGAVTVNRHLLQRGDQRALVLYWYQGRGRVEANEYVVKWDLLRDAALRGRSDEALVRVIVPVTVSEQMAFEQAVGVAKRVMPAVDLALPS